MHIAVRFAAKCTAFCCILRCVLVQNTLQQLAIRLHFLVVADANLGEIFFKEKCISTKKMLKFHRLGAFYMAFGGCFLLEWFGRGAQFVKYIYHINKSQTDTFQDKDNSYISA